MQKWGKRVKKKKAKRILLRLHEAGGCDAQDDYSKGWDEAITEAIKITLCAGRNGGRRTTASP